ncbi:hypothetical protein GQ600_9853 [Phytophthora cactorum]|nr:hypothetical protein GQ600_9853 [Phytophthora cactorum]
MIHFEEKTTLHVSKCNMKAVHAVCREMTQENKLLAFFILDEMTSNANTAAGERGGGGRTQQLFSATSFVVQSGGSITRQLQRKQHKWVSVVPQFPPYQVVFHTTEDEEAWKKSAEQFPVLNDIAEASRGRFARYFVEAVLKYMAGHRTVSLCTLLDETFGEVCLRTHRGKKFMGDKKRKYAQLMAISYTNAAYSLLPTAAAMGALPVKKRKTGVGTESMHLHFANLVDTRVTDVFLAKKELALDDGEQWKPLCCFPGMEEDLLLPCDIGWDVVLGSEHAFNKDSLFGLYGGKVFPVDENSDTRSNNYKTFENMIAQALLCVATKWSRGNSFR